MNNVPDHLQAELEHQESPDVCAICLGPHHCEDCRIFEEKVVKAGVITCGNISFPITSEGAGNTISQLIQRCIDEYSEDQTATIHFTISINTKS